MMRHRGKSWWKRKWRYACIALIMLLLVWLSTVWMKVMRERIIQHDQPQEEQQLDNVPTTQVMEEVETPPHNDETQTATTMPPLPILPTRADRLHLIESNMDPLHTYRGIPIQKLISLENPQLHTTPLNSLDGLGMPKPCDRIVMADQGKRFGGFTADLGFILQVSMYAFETGACPEFPKDWGHGCTDEGVQGMGGWTCLFQPIQQSTLGNNANTVEKQEILRSADKESRAKVRRDVLYLRESEGKNRYPHLMALRPWMPQYVTATSDVLAWRLIFKWTFRIREDMMKLIDVAIQEIWAKNGGIPPVRYAAAHVRLGDKIGQRPGPREAGEASYDVNDFAIKLKLHYGSEAAFPPFVFVATDDYRAVTVLQSLVPKHVTVVTSAHPKRDKGFSIVEYHKESTAQQKFNASLRLWADMVILSKAETVVLSFQSNVGRIVHLMRLEYPANSTLAVDRFGVARCDPRNRYNGNHNNMWLCPGWL